MATATQKPPKSHRVLRGMKLDEAMPPLAGTDTERAAVALAVGCPEAFGEKCRTVEQLIRSMLLWEM